MYRDLDIIFSFVFSTNTCDGIHSGLLSDKCLVCLLRHWCKIGSDPKDAEEFVEEACKDGRILPNASTVNNLNKLWDTHDQLHV